ncbi:MAG TPA: LysR family transcriptional regulator [Pusillimonas sp.]|uniref:winged helix-turn-helix domain-containing protein n=1 Tax=unclassified Pusillimonas TaxID=2640016 RepID=UPI0026379431|nr:MULTISPECIES: LysR family transcriptional regulator [unclassified Pusillimonas]HLU20820.1 LysR family transcriptional regulator [Pusillimonas sp.]
MTSSNSTVQFRMRIYRDGAIAIGPGRVALLEAIDRAGSISGAARALKMSYRRAWLLVNDTNNALKEPAVSSSEGGVAGGGSRLTATGRALVTHYRNIEAAAARAAQADIDALTALIAKQPSGSD